MGNCGDLPIGVILSLGNYPPFHEGDAVKGVAYVSAFLVLTNIFFFTIGYHCFEQDFQCTLSNTSNSLISDSEVILELHPNEKSKMDKFDDAEYTQFLKDIE